MAENTGKGATKWDKLEGEYKWDGGDLYREETLTLENICDSTGVVVTSPQR